MLVIKAQLKNKLGKWTVRHLNIWLYNTEFSILKRKQVQQKKKQISDRISAADLCVREPTCFISCWVIKKIKVIVVVFYYHLAQTHEPVDCRFCRIPDHWPGFCQFKFSTWDAETARKGAWSCEKWLGECLYRLIELLNYVAVFQVERVSPNCGNITHLCSCPVSQKCAFSASVCCFYEILSLDLYSPSTLRPHVVFGFSTNSLLALFLLSVVS